MSYDVILENGMMKRACADEKTDFTFGVSDAGSIEPLLELYNFSVDPVVSESHRRSFKECSYEGAVPWGYAVPARQFKSSLRSLVDGLNDFMSTISTSPYSSFFCETNRLFGFLQESKIDKEKCSFFLEDNDNHVLKSMLEGSDKNGMLPVPTYNRVSTKTGRLVIKAGPQFLTMKKTHRNVFLPSDPKSKLFEIDFTSLEPRVALNIAKQNCSSDVYTTFATFSGLNVTRDVAKLAVLCALYGAGKYRLESVLRKDGSQVKAAELLQAVRDYFCIDNLSKALTVEAREGKIFNCFGRPIEVDDARSSVLINNFLQSSASDIALSGFLHFCETFRECVKPLFVIHDALVFEASPEHLGCITEYVDNGYELKNVGNFPLKIMEFGAHG